jgi:hypothetical protein
MEEDSIPILNPPPKMDTIEDLLKITSSPIQYANIDYGILRKIREPLQKINDMVGLATLKKTLLHQVLYFIQHLTTDQDNYLHTVIMGPSGIGKCVHPNSRLVSFTGDIIQASEINTRTVLMGDDSTPRRVLSICTGNEEMFRIQNQWIVNRSHVLSLIHATTDDTIDITLSSFLEDPHKWDDWRMYKTSIQFPYRPTEIDSYIAGYSLFQLRRHDDHAYSLRILDENVLSYFMSQKIITKITNHPNLYAVPKSFFQNSEILQKQIPSCFRVNRHDVIYYFLAGIYDAIGTNGNLFLPKSLEDDIVFMHTVIGLDVQIQQLVMVIDNTRTETESNILLHCTNPPSLIKSITIPSIRKYPIQIEPVNETNYIGFELDGNGRFLFADGLVSHNTTIAFLIGELYKKLGVLSENAEFRCAKREDFVAEYIGQTATKTNEFLTKCLDGIVFIDEVYSFGGEKGPDSYAKEAIDTINLFISENGSRFCCIIAGYEEEVIKYFFSINQGLSRRFPWVHHLEPYTNNELAQIFIKIVTDIGWKTEVGIERIAEIIRDNKHKFQYNGGDIRNFVTKCKIAHAIRIIYENSPKRFSLSELDLITAISMMTNYSKESMDWKTMFL